MDMARCCSSTWDKKLKTDLIFRKILRIYIITATIFSILVITTQLIVNFSLIDSYNYADKLYIIGKERVLSNVITKDAMALSMNDSDWPFHSINKMTYLTELNSTLSSWINLRSSHDYGANFLTFFPQNKKAFDRLHSEWIPLYNAITNSTNELLLSFNSRNRTDLLRTAETILLSEGEFDSLIKKTAKILIRDGKQRLILVLGLSWTVIVISSIMILSVSFCVLAPLLKKAQVLQRQNSSENEAKMKAEADLKHLSHSILSYVSHEIRNPLNSIAGLAQISLSNLHSSNLVETISRPKPRSSSGPNLNPKPNPEPNTEPNPNPDSIGTCTDAENPFHCALVQDLSHNLNLILNSCDWMEKILDEVIYMQRLSSRQVDFVTKEAKIEDVLKKVIEDSKPKLKSDVCLSYFIHEDIKQRVFMFDEEKVFQILQSLISNAVKFTSAGEISLIVEHGMLDADPPHTQENVNSSMDVCSEFITFLVKDTGKGISHEYHGKIFQPFFQVSPDDAVTLRGNGLSLYYSKLLVELMGGKIKFESNLDQGSTFSFSIPLTFYAKTTNVDFDFERRILHYDRIQPTHSSAFSISSRKIVEVSNTNMRTSSPSSFSSTSSSSSHLSSSSYVHKRMQFKNVLSFFIKKKNEIKVKRKENGGRTDVSKKTDSMDSIIFLERMAAMDPSPDLPHFLPCEDSFGIEGERIIKGKDENIHSFSEYHPNRDSRLLNSRMKERERKRHLSFPSTLPAFDLRIAIEEERGKEESIHHMGRNFSTLNTKFSATIRSPSPLSKPTPSFYNPNPNSGSASGSASASTLSLTSSASASASAFACASAFASVSSSNSSQNTNASASANTSANASYRDNTSANASANASFSANGSALASTSASASARVSISKPRSSLVSSSANFASSSATAASSSTSTSISTSVSASTCDFVSISPHGPGMHFDRPVYNVTSSDSLFSSHFKHYQRDDEMSNAINKDISFPKNSNKSSKCLHCLVVDDVKVNRMIICRILKSMNHTYEEAENGMEAVYKVSGLSPPPSPPLVSNPFSSSHPTPSYSLHAQLNQKGKQNSTNRHTPFDVVFMDVRMPVMNGKDALIKIREWEKMNFELDGNVNFELKTSNHEHYASSNRVRYVQNKQVVCKLPVVFVTANANPEEMRVLWEAGAYDVIPKPIKIKKLQEILEGVSMMAVGTKK